tara:strand:+ start:219 stop:413 length:195 start_codon:yes stop_codon:yes gene_type:complete
VPNFHLSTNRAVLRQELRERCEQLMLLLADQVQNLPLGNESWMSIERELVAAERALARLPLADG